MNPQPLFVMDLLSGLGFGEQVIVGATLVITALYLRKGKSAAGMFVGLMGTVWLVATSAVVATAVAIFMGWVDPVPHKFFADVMAGGKAAIEFALGPLDDWVRNLVSGLG